MMQLAIINLLVGAVFGLRFRVLVLLPLTFASGVVALVVALVARESLFESLTTFASCALALQGGYLFGSVMRFTLAAARSTRMLGRPLKTAIQK